MADPKEKTSAPPEVPDDGPHDPVKRRKQAFWMVLICLIVIIVTFVMIVNELTH